jgi:hypothetical protein
MNMILAFLIGFAGGWSLMACDALFRAEERPGIFRGTAGMVLLLVVTGVGGLTLAGATVWAFQTIISSGVVVIIAGGMVLGFGASKRLHVNAAGAANRMMVGLAVLVALYGIVWSYYPPPPPPPTLTKTAPMSK